MTTVNGADTGAGTDVVSSNNVSLTDTDYVSGSGQTVYLNNASGGTNGTAVTTGNSGGASGTAFSTVSGTVTYDNTEVTGASTLSYKFVSSASTAYVSWNVPAAVQSSVQYYEGYFYYGTIFPGDIFDTNAGHYAVSVSLAGALIATASPGAAVSTPTGFIQTGTWYRLEAQVNPAAGTLVVYIYNASTGNLLKALNASGGSATSITNVYFGTAGPETGTLWMSALGISTIGWLAGTSPVSGNDTVVSIGLAGGDSGAGTEALTSPSSISAADSGVGTDAPVKISITGADSVAGTDAVNSPVPISAGDSGVGTDITFVKVTFLDSGTGTDTGVVYVTVNPADSVSCTENTTSPTGIVAADFGGTSGAGAYGEGIYGEGIYGVGDTENSWFYLPGADNAAGTDSEYLTSYVYGQAYGTALDFGALLWFVVEAVQGDIRLVALYNNGPGPGQPQFRVPISGTVKAGVI